MWGQVKRRGSALRSPTQEEKSHVVGVHGPADEAVHGADDKVRDLGQRRTVVLL